VNIRDTLGTGERTTGPTGAAAMRMPVVFIPHGGGPWPFVDLGLDAQEVEALTHYLQSLRDLPQQPPRALLVVSAHWEERVPTLMNAEKPALYYDYYGFPPESYRISWPALGDPQLAARVASLLTDAGIANGVDAKRGFDHGTFVPLKLTYPAADVPCLQLSLQAGLDPAEHLRIGRALAALRDEGVFIIGSGMSFHNLRSFRDPRAIPVAETFDAWLGQTVALPPAQRDAGLVAWANAPSARLAHPREEHLLPLMVVAGAAGSDQGTTAFNGTVMGMRVSAYQFG
jgi:aromatic ring-opening dioxygenase catalytic subunit (LigB family)